MRCLSCKYDLSHLTEHRCPECGREFDPNDPKSFETLKSARRRAWMRFLFWILGLWAFSTLVYILVMEFVSGVDEPFLFVVGFSLFSGFLCMLLISPFVVFGLIRALIRARESD
jgi:hypothetical protein